MNVSNYYKPIQKLKLTNIKQTIWNLVRRHGKFNEYEEIISLQFNMHDTSQHICKHCLRKLQKRHGLRTNLRELNKEIFQSYSSKA